MKRKHPNHHDAADDSISGDLSSSPQKRSRAHKLELARAEDGAWEFVPSRCARKRQEDLEEVEKMIAAGELEIAQDELRWLLSECRDFLAAHKLLGDIAEAAGDFRLARGHYGYAYQLGTQAIDRAGKVDSLASDRAPNQVFFAAGLGLVTCLMKMGKRGVARDVAERLVALDPRDLLKIKQIVDGSEANQQRRQKRKR